MESTRDLLVEIGTEELPPKALPTLALAFREAFGRQLEETGIAFGEIESFAAPRRLALMVRRIAERQPDRDVVRRGPSVQAAFSVDGVPTKAVLGFAASCGVGVEALSREGSDKGEWVVFRSRQIGAATAGLIPGLTETALASLPIPKRMRWGTGVAEFVRPVHWVCMLLGTEPVVGRVLGIEAGRATRGHRFHHPEAITLSDATDYAEALRHQGYVEPDFERRRESVRAQVHALASEHGLRARVDPALLDEVTALVEWPHALLGHFDPAYLRIPSEVLIETMQSHQKYFPLEDAAGGLASAFIAIANIESREPEQVRAGNERVIRPRFADAAFFWEQDLKRPLERYADRLSSVVFQDRLGSMAEKVARVEALSRRLAPSLGVEADLVGRAARLGRCDLVTAMVGEFPGLQGTMGRYYAEQAGEPDCVVAAMEEQYLPRFAGDRLPISPCGLALAVADRVDTLIGIFGIGLRPTGAKDPYGLRRASIGVLRILIETPVALDLRVLLRLAYAGYPTGLLSADVEAETLAYMLERLRSYYHERGIALDTVDAVVHTGVTEVSDLDRRIAAVAGFRELPAAETLASANKRIRNLLSKAGMEAGSDPVEGALAEHLSEPAEIRLAARVDALRVAVAPLAEARDYGAVLTALADLAPDLDAFFDEVLVMTEDPVQRESRLRLLRSLAGLFLLVADISRLQ